jgi:hypothetical protein
VFMRCARYAERNIPVFSSALTCVWADVGRPRKTERGGHTHQEGLARRAVLHGRELDAVEDGHRAERAVRVLELGEPEALRLVRGRDEALERLDRAARLRRPVSVRAYSYRGGRAHGEEGVEEAVGDAGSDGADEEVRRALRAGRDAERGRAEVLLLGESLD